MAEPGSKAGLTRKQKYEKLVAQMKNDIQSFLSHWKDLNDYILPRRGRFQLTDRNRGDRRTKNIIDSTATFAARTLSSGMMSGITSPARPWFRLSTPDPDLAERATVKDWLHTVTQRMSTVFLRSNWYNVLPTLYYDLGVFGTAAMMIEEDDEDVIRCSSFPVGSYYIANDSKGRVRVFVREFGMTVRQIVERFGRNGDDMSNISTPVRTAWEQGTLDTWFDVVHVIAPNPEYDVNRLGSRYKQFTSCYYERGNNDPDLYLEEKGYHEFPVFVPRWAVTGEDVYATDCPGMTVLGDVKALQLGEKRAAQAMEKQLNPPMVAPPSMQSFRLSIIAGDVSYVPEGPNTNSTFRPAHEVKPALQEWEYRQERIRQRINEGMYANLFLMLAYSDPSRGKQPVTATEIAERQEEKLLALGPVLEQLNQDLLDPGIDRVFAIMMRAGLIPPPPQELEGVSLRVEYISIMAQAQKMIGLSSLERFSGFLSQQLAATPQDPSILDKVDRDQMIDEYADMTGIPPRIIVPDEQVAAIRAQRAKAAQAQRATESAMQEARAAKDLSAAKTSPDNALGQLLGGMGGSGAGTIPGLAA
jgi:hypothetical protein